MNLSKKQKLACKLINKDKVYDIYTFMILIYPELFISVKKIFKQGTRNSQYTLETNNINCQTYSEIDLGRNDHIFMYKNQNDVKKGLIQFLNLIKVLEAEHFIIRVRKLGGLITPIQWLLPYNNKIDTECLFENNSLRCNQSLLDDFFFKSDYHFHSLSEFKIVPTIYLNEFIKSGYRTYTEKTNKITFTIGCVGILIAVVSSICSILLLNKTNKENAIKYNEITAEINIQFEDIKTVIMQENNNTIINNSILEKIDSSLNEVLEVVKKADSN